MKVIIDIKNPLSQYYKYNGLTFEVKELMNSSVGVLLRDGNLNQTDFHFNEILIVDFQQEVKSCLKFNFTFKLKKLQNYSRIKGIHIDNLILKYYES